jgi:dynein heavy chain
MSDYTVSKRLLAMYLNKCGKDDVIPWASLKYLIGEAMYGGRVTDDFDRRLMMTYLNEYMGDFIFDTNQKFFFSRIGFEYEVPENTAYDGYLKYIESIPNTYSPEVIGLHSNAEIDYFTQASLLLWTNLIVLQKSSGSESGEKAIDKESFVKDLSTSIRQKLPQRFDIQAINRKFQIKTPIQVIIILT